MSGAIEFEITSALDTGRRDVWRVVHTMKGVNDELHPFLHMTSANGPQVLSAPVLHGEVVVRSWLLLFRVLPFDRHFLALEQIEEGHGFVEESNSWLQRRWRHERHLVDRGDHGCSMTDRLVVEPRLGFSRPVVAWVVSTLFQHRHRRLSRRFGS